MSPWNLFVRLYDVSWIERRASFRTAFRLHNAEGWGRGRRNGVIEKMTSPSACVFLSSSVYLVREGITCNSLLEPWRWRERKRKGSNVIMKITSPSVWASGLQHASWGEGRREFQTGHQTLDKEGRKEGKGSATEASSGSEHPGICVFEASAYPGMKQEESCNSVSWRWGWDWKGRRGKKCGDGNDMLERHALTLRCMSLIRSRWKIKVTTVYLRSHERRWKP